MSVKISIFPNTIGVDRPKDVDIDKFLNAIKIGKWQDDILKLRTEKDPVQYKLLKEALPNGTISGTFSYRSAKGLTQHSGFIAIDIDKLGEAFHDIRGKLIKDEYFYALFTSCSGNGLCGIVKIDPALHKESFLQIRNYLLDAYGVKAKADKGCSDVNRTRYVSYDPDIYLNPDSIIFQAKKQAAGRPKKIEKKDYLIVPSDFEAVVKEIREREIDITTDYERWCYLGFSIATSFEEEGREYFHQLSEIHPEYEYDECDKKYDNFLETKTGDLNISWFYDHIRREYNIKAYSEHTEAILRATQAAFEFKMADGVEGVKSLLIKKHGFTKEQADDAEPLIDQAIKKRIPIGGDSLIADVESFLYQRFDIKKNTLIQTIEVDGKKMDQAKLNTLYTDAAKVYPKVTLGMVRAVTNTDYTPKYNPFDDLINKYLLNPPAEPRGHIDRMIATITTDTPNAAYFIKKWMVAMVPSAKGEHSVLMLVFCGAVNTGKTEWFRRYLPASLKQYRADNSLEEGKDSDILMSKKLLILDDEMGGKTKAETKKMKNMTSKQEMSVRKPYDAEESDLNRIAMLAGTTNDMEIIPDPTENRRTIPINIISIDHDAYNAIDKELVLFECYLEWKAGFNPRLTNADIIMLRESSRDFVMTNFTEELFNKFFGHPDKYTGTIERLSRSEIVVALSHRAGIGGRIDPVKLSKHLKDNNFNTFRTNSARGWEVIQISSTDQEEMI